MYEKFKTVQDTQIQEHGRERGEYGWGGACKGKRSADHSGGKSDKEIKIKSYINKSNQ